MCSGSADRRRRTRWDATVESDVADRVLHLGAPAACRKHALRDRLIEHGQYMRGHGVDMPEVRDWQWSTPR